MIIFLVIISEDENAVFNGLNDIRTYPFSNEKSAIKCLKENFVIYRNKFKDENGNINTSYEEFKEISFSVHNDHHYYSGEIRILEVQ